LGSAELLGFPTRRQIQYQRLSRLLVGALVEASQNRLRPRPLGSVEILAEVAGLVDLTPLDKGGVPEGRAHRLAQGLRAIEDHEQAAIGAQAATLEIGEQTLAHGRVLRRAVPQAERVFLAVRRDSERDDEAVIADVDPV